MSENERENLRSIQNKKKKRYIKYRATIMGVTAAFSVETG